MATVITTIAGTDVISTSRTTINSNFSSILAEKIELDYLSTDTTLAANSDTKIATQKAVKTYIDTSGGANASETIRGIVEEASDAEVTAGTATGATGAKLFVTPAKLATRLTTVLATYQLSLVYKNGIATRTINTASGSQTIAHGVGKAPTHVRMVATCKCNQPGSRLTSSWGSYNGTTTSAVWNDIYVGSSTSYEAGNTTSQIIVMNGEQVATIAVDATNITLTWTRSGSSSGTDIQIIWEAEA